MKIENEAIRTLLRRAPVAVDPQMTLRAVAQILAEESIGAVVVRRERPLGTPHSYTIGVVSERDISHAVARGMDPDTTRAADVMTAELADAEPDETILRVATRMMANEVRHLPVNEGEELIGVISERDVLRALVQALHDQSKV
ncbi:MAG: CBS domain-containing protein [Acidimicrobiia bacterium]